MRAQRQEPVVRGETLTKLFRYEQDTDESENNGAEKNEPTGRNNNLA
ncbi:hypothetical protein Despr_3302 [Desulfobulbus propionicus DSM 2032]|jgi:hypothetical protein|uniref:Uncharacterized protein n=1 Tax=Desulfobulbus propionicus (strain ATCC 33891 / DSM 2032 / VKM B-1956 / 1pr3) TaxID=577650 RepID=A0A7U3YPZ5_DESPD|nr:hypothetical protein [Desulfobulbus propionicus]ADW19429.1 hypothetical protein Despr_3302 [Desulfobulbus propionicus DSM 2032]